MSFTQRSQKASTRAALAIAALAVIFCLASTVQAQVSGDAAVSLKAHPGWVQAPGWLGPPNCVYEAPNGAHLAENGDLMLNGSVIAHYSPCPETPIRTRPLHMVAPHFADEPGTGNGWVEAAQQEVSLNSGDSLDKITGTWVVPSNPSSSGVGLIYLFNGLEPTTEA
jgi:hypothetical protein